MADDSEAEYEGDWILSKGLPQYIERGYHQDKNEGKGEKIATFSSQLEEAGTYQVSITYPADSNRASNVPVTIYHKGGQVAVEVNQRVNEAKPFGFLSSLISLKVTALGYPSRGGPQITSQRSLG